MILINSLTYQEQVNIEQLRHKNKMTELEFSKQIMREESRLKRSTKLDFATPEVRERILNKRKIKIDQV